MAIQQGSGFTNLQKIIGANQNNQLGNTIQSGINKNISGLQNNVDQSQQQFNTDANNANQNTQQNQQYAQGVINNIVNPTAGANSAAPQGQTPTPQVTDSSNVQQNQNSTPTVTDTGSSNNSSQSTSPAANSGGSGYAGAIWGGTAAPQDTSTPGSFGTATSTVGSGTNQTSNTNAPAAADIQRFGNLLQGGYMGPNQLNNYSALQAQGQQLQSQGQNLNSQGGLQSLLQQYVGGNNYNKGEQGLDTLILGQTGQPQLRSVANNLRSAGTIPQAAEAQAQGMAQQIGAGNQQFASGLQNALTSAQNPILQSIQQNINGLNQKNANGAAIGSQLYNLLNNPTQTAPAAGGVPNHIGGGLAAPTTDAGVAQQAMNDALANGVIDQDTYDLMNKNLFATMSNIDTTSIAPQIANGYVTPAQLQGEVAQAQAHIGDPKTILAQLLNYNPATAAPTYTMQQGANAQQAAQLNALAQLGGQQQQYGTYGGATTIAPTFDTSKIPAFYNLPNQLNVGLTEW